MAKVPKDEAALAGAFDVDVKKIVESYKTGMFAAEDDIQAYRQELEHDINQIQKDERTLAAEETKALRERVVRDVAAAERAGIEINEQFRAKLIQKNAQEQTAKKIQSEIEILKSTSKLAEQDRARQLSTLNNQKKYLEARKKLSDAEYIKDKKAREAAKAEAKKEMKEAKKGQAKDGVSEGLANVFKEFREEMEEGNAIAKTAAQNTEKAMKQMGKALTDGLNAINNSIAEYAKHQTAVNARLNGAADYKGSGNFMAKGGSGGYGKIAANLSAIAYSPLLRAEDLYANVSDIVNQGIVTNIEQRALFATIKDGIATTFDVTSESLKRIIRVQRNDSTAARLGMEAYLNEFLNVYVENTEYLTATFDTVASSLLEASAMIKYNSGNVADSLEFEYQVQKWLGSLTGMGLSDEAASAIAAAIGQLGSGDVDQLSSSEINNLLLMGANKGNVSYAEMLTNGVTADDVNSLMYGMVSYMQEIATSDNNIIKNQLAKTFGISVSDVISAANLTQSNLDELKGEYLAYEGMYGALRDNFAELPSRLGIANILENAFANFTYQTGANIGSNPALYALWKITDMVNSVTGGINIPHITAMGSGIGFEATVENLMKLGIVGISTLGGIGDIVSGIASVGNAAGLLDKVGVNSDNAVIQEIEGGLSKRDKDSGKRQSGDDSSGGKVVGNEDGSTYSDSALNDAQDDAQKDLDKAEEEFEDPTVLYLDETVKLEDKLTKIVDGVTALQTSALLVSGTNMQLFYVVGALEQNLRNYLMTRGGTTVYIDPKVFAKQAESGDASSGGGSAAPAPSANTSMNVNMTNLDIGTQLDPVIEKLVAIADNTAPVPSTLKTSFDKLSTDISAVTAELVAIKTSNDAILAEYKNSSKAVSTQDNSTTVTANATDVTQTTLDNSNTSINQDTSVLVGNSDITSTLMQNIQLISDNISEALDLIKQEIGVPKGETSALTPNNNMDVDNSSNVENIINPSQPTLGISGYLASDNFMTDFRSIVDNVARIAGDPNSKNWSNPASGQANYNSGYNSSMPSSSGTIDGFTQQSNSYNNPLLS